MTAALTLSRTSSGQGMMNIYGASGMMVGNVGQLTGSASFTLSGTDDNNQTVFNVIQANSYNSANLNMTANNKNIDFYGTNINAAFGSECEVPYNITFSTTNSRYDFSNTRTGAMVTATVNAMGNEVLLGGGAQYINAVEVAAGSTATGEKEIKYVHNQVFDSGYSNAFIATAYDTNNFFLTTEASEGAFMSGAGGTDVFNIQGTYGVFAGVSGYNIFTTKACESLDDDGAHRNIVLGGEGYNVYNDYGMHNMYLGAYATTDQQYGYDTIRMNGRYGVARFDTSVLKQGVDSQIFFNGSYNVGFTGANETRNAKGETVTSIKSFKDYLNGTFASYQSNNGRNWTLKDFYGAEQSAVGPAREYGLYYLSGILDA